MPLWVAAKMMPREELGEAPDRLGAHHAVAGRRRLPGRAAVGGLVDAAAGDAREHRAAGAGEHGLHGRVELLRVLRVLLGALGDGLPATAADGLEEAGAGAGVDRRAAGEDRAHVLGAGLLEAADHRLPVVAVVVELGTRRCLRWRRRWWSGPCRWRTHVPTRRRSRRRDHRGPTRCSGRGAGVALIASTAGTRAASSFREEREAHTARKATGARCLFRELPGVLVAVNRHIDAKDPARSAQEVALPTSGAMRKSLASNWTLVVASTALTVIVGGLAAPHVKRLIQPAARG